MKEDDRVCAVVSEWVEKAEEDFTAATLLLRAAEACPTAVAVFHAQQIVEKYLKAVLVARGITFPRTHDISRLVPLLPHADRPRLSAAQQDEITRYATVARYPGMAPVTLSEARRAVALARRIRGEIRKRLPIEALGRARK